ncbi:MAG: acyl-CoA thioesterase [Clostridia bacterium]|nr:acyl-CoA thioesterase [Clostridia bacterium]
MKQVDKQRSEARTVSYSRAEQVQIILPMNVNASFQLFGGLLMQWIDVVAAVVARKHSGCQVTTAAVDHLEFLASANLNDVVLLQGRMIHTGRSSMEVCVETFVEQMENGGERKLVNRAFVTLVALDQDRRPTAVPALLPETAAEKADYEMGRQKWLKRKKT